MLNAFKEYFSFSKKELNGILVLCILIFLVLITPTVYSMFTVPEQDDFAEFDKEIAKFYASEKDEPAYSYNRSTYKTEVKTVPAEYFKFDPNGLAEESWHRLGLNERQIKIIKNYESKGGKFFKKEDLKKIYSLSPVDYARLEPYIEIANSYSKKTWKSAVRGSEKRSNYSSFKIVEINSADSAQLETLRGIGPAFASRIVRYRNRLGGFYSKEQLREVYGIDSLKYAGLKDQISVDPANVQKINVNTAKFEDLKRFPYLSYKQMNAIIQYRSQHGSFRSVNDLKKVIILNEEILRKIEPYLIF